MTTRHTFQGTRGRSRGQEVVHLSFRLYICVCEDKDLCSCWTLLTHGDVTFCRYTAVLQVQRAMREYSRAARRYALQTAAALRLQAAARGWAARRQASSHLMRSSHVMPCLGAIRWVHQRLAIELYSLSLRQRLRSVCQLLSAVLRSVCCVTGSSAACQSGSSIGSRGSSAAGRAGRHCTVGSHLQGPSPLPGSQVHLLEPVIVDTTARKCKCRPDQATRSIVCPETFVPDRWRLHCRRAAVVLQRGWRPQYQRRAAAACIMQRGVRTLLARRAAARAEAAAVVLQVRWQPQYICCGTHAMPDPIPLFPAMCIPFKSTLYMVARVVLGV
jgi:hypothetical protein